MKNRLMLLGLVVIAAVMAGIGSDHRCIQGNLGVRKRVCVGGDASFGHRTKFPLHVLRAQERLQVLAGVLKFPHSPGITFTPGQSNGPVIQGTLSIANPCMQLVRGCSLSVGPMRGEDKGQVEFRIPVKFCRPFSKPPTVLAGVETGDKTLFVTEVTNQNDSAFLGPLLTTVEDLQCDGFTLVLSVIIVSSDETGALVSDLLNQLLSSLSFDIAVYGPPMGMRDWSGQRPKRSDDLFVHSLMVKKDLCIGDWLQFGSGLGACAVASDWPNMQISEGSITVDSVAEISVVGSETASDIPLDIRANATLAIDGFCASVSLTGSIREVADQGVFYVDLQVPVDFPRTFSCPPLAEISVGNCGQKIIAQQQSGTQSLIVSVLPVWTAPTRGSGIVRLFFIFSADNIASVLSDLKKILATLNIDLQLIGVPFSCSSRNGLFKSESEMGNIEDFEPVQITRSAGKSKTVCIDGSLCVARDLCVGGAIRFPCNLSAVGSANSGGALTRGIVALPKQLGIKISSDYKTVTVENNRLCLVAGAGLAPGALEIRSRYFDFVDALYITVFIPVDRCPDAVSCRKLRELIVNTQIGRCTPWVYVRDEQEGDVALISVYSEVINRGGCILGTPAVTFILSAEPGQTALVEQFLEELIGGMQLHLAVLSGC